LNFWVTHASEDLPRNSRCSVGTAVPTELLPPEANLTSTIVY